MDRLKEVHREICSFFWCFPYPCTSEHWVLRHMNCGMYTGCISIPTKHTHQQPLGWNTPWSFLYLQLGKMADWIIQPLETRSSISIISTINLPLKLSRDYLLLALLLCRVMTNLPPQLGGLKCKLCDMHILISWWEQEQGSVPADPMWNLAYKGHHGTARKRKRSYSPTGSWLSHLKMACIVGHHGQSHAMMSSTVRGRTIQLPRWEEKLDVLLFYH